MQHRHGILLSTILLSIGALFGAGACGDNSAKCSGATCVENPALTDRVSVIRDNLGIAHITAKNVRDLGFVQGYITAHDRLPQMDILRRNASGTLAEMYGAVSPGLITADMEIRMYRMRYYAEQSWNQMKASSDPIDQQLVEMLEGYALGVNAYAADLVAGKFTLDPEIEASFDPDRFAPWNEIDSLTLGRYQAYSLSTSLAEELAYTDVAMAANEVYLGATIGNLYAYNRRGITKDLLRLTPIGDRITTPPDTTLRRARNRPAAAHRPAFLPSQAAAVHAAVKNARTVFAPSHVDRGIGNLDPHLYQRPNAGSNTWAVAPSKTANGSALLIGDQHLSLPNPSVFYPVQLTVPGVLDGYGITFPGIPGIILGHNGKTAWSSTTAYHDVMDIFAESIEACVGGGDCVDHNSALVPIETRTETFGIGVLGTVSETVTATYETVPHHGPIIPTFENGRIVPRTANTALSVQYTGHEPTFEIRAIWKLLQSNDVQAGIAALDDFSFGGQNWVLIDTKGNIGWTMHAKVPRRKVGAFTWDPDTNQDGTAPFMVLPGDGSADWDGFIPPERMPQAYNPDGGVIVTANADPVGATFDGDYHNDGDVDGLPWFLSADYAIGLRQERISDKLDADIAESPVDLQDMAALQHDTFSSSGAKFVPAILEACDDVDEASDAASLCELFADWDFSTPTGGADASAAAVRNSAATSAFNAWGHFFVRRLLEDEYELLGMSVWSLGSSHTMRIVDGVLNHPTSMWPGTSTPEICKEAPIEGAGACGDRIREALDAAATWLASADGFGSSNPAQWMWGKKHIWQMHALFPNAELDLPPANDPTYPGGVPRPGDNDVVNRADCGWNDLQFRQATDGSAQRFMAEAPVGGPLKAYLQLPTGTVYNRASPFYRLLLDVAYIPQVHQPVPFTPTEVRDAAAEFWAFSK